MVTITEIKSEVIDGVITIDIPGADICARCYDNEFFVLKNVFDPAKLKSMYEDVFSHYEDIDPIVESGYWGQPNYWRVDNNPPKSSNSKKIQVFYSAFPWNKEFPEAIEVGKMLGSLRNRIAGLDPEYGFRPDDDWLSVPLLQHYPEGGGYLGKHVDVKKPQRVVVSLSLGKTCSLGGFWIEVDGQPLSLEHLFSPGDIMIHRPDIPHGVAPIDPGKGPVNFRSSAGRWRMSTILVPPHELDSSKSIPQELSRLT
jgi:hypothetical protein